MLEEEISKILDKEVITEDFQEILIILLHKKGNSALISKF
jgi:hypothetical protein